MGRSVEFATFYVHGVNKEFGRSIQILEKWLPRLPDGSARLLHLSDMACYIAASGGSQRAAYGWLDAAKRNLDTLTDSQDWELYYFQVSSARVDLFFGHHVASLEWLLEISPSDQHRIKHLMQWTRELIAQNQLFLASRYLSRAQDLLTVETPPVLRHEFAALSYRL